MNQEVDQELLFKLQEIHQQSKELEEKLGVVDKQVLELREFDLSLEELQKNEGNEILASVGKGVFVKAEKKDEKLFVDVGSGIFLRKSFGEAKDIVSGQIERLGELRIQMISETESLNERIRNLIDQAEK